MIGSVQKMLLAATHSENVTGNHTSKIRIRLAIIPSRSILTPGQPVLALALDYHASGRLATRVSFSTKLVDWPREYHFLLVHCWDLTCVQSQDFPISRWMPYHVVIKAVKREHLQISCSKTVHRFTKDTTALIHGTVTHQRLTCTIRVSSLYWSFISYLSNAECWQPLLKWHWCYHLSIQVTVGRDQ